MSRLKYVEELLGWCKNSALILNINKTKELVISRTRQDVAVVPVSIESHSVEIVDNIKYLGTFIDSKHIYKFVYIFFCLSHWFALSTMCLMPLYPFLYYYLYFYIIIFYFMFYFFLHVLICIFVIVAFLCTCVYIYIYIYKYIYI